MHTSSNKSMLSQLIDLISRSIAALQGPSTMKCRERGSHERGVFPTHGNSKCGTKRKKQVQKQY